MHIDGAPSLRRSGNPRPVAKSLVAWLLISVALLGFFVVWIANADPAMSAQDAEPDATATRAAELDELNHLRTQVAELSTALAELQQPSPTPTQVPPGEMGQEYPYQDGWTVEVIDAVPVGGTDAFKPNGAFLRVNIILTNNGREAEIFPFHELVLVDGQQRTYVISADSSRDLIAPDWDFFVEPSQPTNKSFIFDVAVDAGTSFVLESATEPGFRVKVEIAQRG